MMKKKENVLFAIGTLALVVIFVASFIFTLKKLENPISKEEQNDVAVSGNKYDGNIDDNTKIVLKVKDGKGDEADEKVLYFKDIAGELNGNNTSEVLQTYLQKENYYLRPTEDGSLVFVRKMYSPNKYYIGVTSKEGKEYLTIYKADKEGKLFIENEKTDIVNFSLDNIPNEDEKNLYRNIYAGEDGNGFATREDAVELLTSFNIK